jgi:hypothetical protein
MVTNAIIFSSADHIIIMSSAAVRAAGFIIYRQFAGAEYLLMQTSYGQHHWTPPKARLTQ